MSGTYSCSVPDPELTSGPGTIGLELGSRAGGATAGSVAVTCDRSTRDWTLTAPAGGLRARRVQVHGQVEVTDSEGNTPWNLVDAAATLRRA